MWTFLKKKCAKSEMTLEYEGYFELLTHGHKLSL